MVAQLVNKFLAIYETQIFITMLQEPEAGLHLNDTKEAHNFIPYFFKIHFNIILPQTPRFPK
jgi:hypothetical protein